MFVSNRLRLKNVLEHIRILDVFLGKSLERNAVRQGRIRLIALLFLFDTLLIVATLFSFQRAEVRTELVELEQTKEVYDIQYREEVITRTTAITTIIPYGEEPPR